MSRGNPAESAPGLSDRQAREAAIVEASADAIFSTDLDGRILTWNEGAAALYGYPVEEAEGQPLGLLFFPEQEDELARVLERIRAGQPVRHFRAVRRHRDGQALDVDLSVSPLRDEDGSVAGVGVVARDVSGLRELEQQARRREQHYESLFNGVDDAVFMHPLAEDGTLGRFTEVNRVACERLGYTAEELQRMTPADIDDPEAAAQVRRPTAEMLLRQGEVRFETVHRTREGRGIPVEIYARAVEVDGRRMVLAAARDITDRKRAEEALRRERDRAQTYLDIAGVAIVALDREGRVRRINQKGASILGRSEEEIVGLDWFASVVAPEDRQAQARAHEAFMAGVVVPEEHFEYRVLAADGGRRTIVWQGSAVLREDGAITGLLMSGDDVTDLRAAEAQHRALEEQLRHAEKMQSIGYLAGGVAHDFNNQLTPIVGYGEMLRKQTREDETLNRYATHVVRAAQRASDLTRQLLAFSRKGALETRPVDIHRLLDEVLNILSRTVDRRIELNRAFDAKYPVVVADSSQLENALLNLAVNARDAMPEGGELTFATQSRKLEEGDPLLVQGGMAAGRYLEVAVRDTGVGIPLEVQGSIFEPFFTTKEVGKGTGLGLAAVYGIVKNHRGDIQVESTPGEGTTFRLLLPMCPEGTEAGDDEEQESEEIRGKGRVLVVDDEAIVRDLLGDVLTSSGYAPQTVENGPQALALLQESPQAFDLVLLDMVMPKLSGLETLREIRQLNRTVPVVVLSGYSRRSNEALLHELGVAAILQKPVTPASLLQTVRDVLDAD